MNETNRLKGSCVRRCAACGQRADKRVADLIRIALPKNGQAQIDPDGTIPGRGAYVCRNRECVERLCRTRRLSRLLRGEVPEAVYEDLRREAERNEK